MNRMRLRGNRIFKRVPGNPGRIDSTLPQEFDFAHVPAIKQQTERSLMTSSHLTDFLLTVVPLLSLNPLMPGKSRVRGLPRP